MSSTSRNRKKYLKLNNKKNINTVIVNPISSPLNRQNNPKMIAHNSLKLSHNPSALYLQDKSPNYHKIFISKSPNAEKKRIFSSKHSNKNIFDCESLFISISSKIESIIFAYKENRIKLCDILRNIENYIYQIIKEKKLNININGRTSKLTLENNVKTLKEKLKKYKNKIILNEKDESKNFILKRKINKLYKKINEMETEFKNEELKYFFCIGDYQKRLDELEQKINLIEIERMPKKELRKYICYPHYLKFDLNEDYNIKAIPMFNLRKKKCYSSKPSNRCDNEIKKTNLSEFNSFENNLTKINSHKFNDLNIESFEGKNILSHSFDNVNEDMNLKEKNINEIINTIKLGKSNFDIKQNIIYRFLGKKKSFFVSHPRLNYIKIGKLGNRLISLKLDNQNNTFSRQISNLKVSNSQKNSMFIFPSSFNETMVNLEKLRTRKNFRNIKNKFEESWKLKPKSHKIKN